VLAASTVLSIMLAFSISHAKFFQYLSLIEECSRNCNHYQWSEILN